jgi:hypothetical protein
VTFDLKASAVNLCLLSSRNAEVGGVETGRNMNHDEGRQTLFVLVQLMQGTCSASPYWILALPDRMIVYFASRLSLHLRCRARHVSLQTASASRRASHGDVSPRD